MHPHRRIVAGIQAVLLMHRRRYLLHDIHRHPRRKGISESVPEREGEIRVAVERRQLHRRAPRAEVGVVRRACAQLQDAMQAPPTREPQGAEQLGDLRISAHRCAGAAVVEWNEAVGSTNAQQQPIAQGLLEGRAIGGGVAELPHTSRGAVRHGKSLLQRGATGYPHARRLHPVPGPADLGAGVEIRQQQEYHEQKSAHGSSSWLASGERRPVTWQRRSGSG